MTVAQRRETGVAGTDRAKDETAPAQPAMILVEPQLGENIGAAARAMLNFGLERMRLVAPRDGWPNPRAVAMASGAGRVLDAARVFGSTAAACADLGTVFATTARARDLTRRMLTPERAMAEARALTAAGERVGVLFGPERAGLGNADIVRSQASVFIPVNPGFGSINLAQSVLILGYEWQRQGEDRPGELLDLAGGRLATGIELDRFLERLVDRLDAVGFFFPEHKRASMLANIGNLLRRARLGDADIRILHGIVRALAIKEKGRK